MQYFDHRKALEEYHDTIKLFIDSARRGFRAYEKLNETAKSLDPEKLAQLGGAEQYEGELAKEFWTQVCDLCLYFSDWYGQCERYKKYYGFDDLPDGFEDTKSNLVKFVVELTRHDGFLQLPAQLIDRQRQSLSVMDWLDELVDFLKRDSGVQGTVDLEAMDPDDDDDFGDDALTLGDYMATAIPGTICDSDAFPNPLDILRNGHPSDPESEEQKKMFVQLWDDRLQETKEEQEAQEKDFYKKYKAAEIPPAFCRGVSFSIENMTHSTLRLSWLDERMSFKTRWVESDKAGKDELLSEQDVKKKQEKKREEVKGELEKLSEKDVDQLSLIVDRILHAIDEIGFANFVGDVMAIMRDDNAKAGVNSPLAANDVMVFHDQCKPFSKGESSKAYILGLYEGSDNESLSRLWDGIKKEGAEGKKVSKLIFVLDLRQEPRPGISTVEVWVGKAEVRRNRGITFGGEKFKSDRQQGDEITHTPSDKNSAEDIAGVKEKVNKWVKKNAGSQVIWIELKDNDETTGGDNDPKLKDPKPKEPRLRGGELPEEDE